MRDLQLRSTILDLLREMESSLNAVLQPIYAPFQITVLQGRALLEISRRKAVTIGELAERLGMACANTSTLCKRLESGGFVVRTRRKEDERVVQISLTEMGEAVLKEVERSINESHHMIMEGQTQEDIDDITQGLEKLNAMLKKITEQNLRRESRNDEGTKIP